MIIKTIECFFFLNAVFFERYADIRDEIDIILKVTNIIFIV